MLFSHSESTRDKPSMMLSASFPDPLAGEGLLTFSSASREGVGWVCWRSSGVGGCRPLPPLVDENSFPDANARVVHLKKKDGERTTGGWGGVALGGAVRPAAS